MRLTIGKKLNSLVLLLSFLGIFGVVSLATHLYSEDLSGLLRKNTLDSASLLSGRVRAEMKHLADQARLLGAISFEEFAHPEDQVKFLQETIAQDAQILGIALYRFQEGQAKAQWRIAQPEAAKRFGLATADFEVLDQSTPLNGEQLGKGAVEFAVGRLKGQLPLLRVGIPLVQREDGSFSQFLVLELQQEKWAGLFADATTSTSFLVDRHHRVLASSDPGRFAPGADKAGLSIFKGSKEGRSPSAQLDFLDEEGVAQIGAFQKVGFGDLAIVSQVPLSRTEAAKTLLYRRTSLLAAAFLFLALCVGFFFSQGITRPIGELAHAAGKIASGDFQVRLPVSKKKGRGDEIVEFAQTFNSMAAGLQERDRVKATFAKFHSKDVAEKLLSGEVKLGGERKSAFVFFSDVRGFTAMSEKLQPEALVHILNRYMTRMVRVILAHGGVVDKYVGDAIMAVWGAPIPKLEDPLNALGACLEMRKALSELNVELMRDRLPTLRIGMGLNYGPLIAGNIGSEERMEYTVIGDTVNTASRIESLTKEFGTDLLVSEEVRKQLEGRFIFEKAHEAKVKGKAVPLIVYKVHGFVGPDGKPVLVQTPYSSYTAEKSDKVVH
ncbi:MAG: adenylate/guanylate cyclase domain-containing protein [Oligoflexia bacterium]|nr:adenylate/guanylate cyclase domain-containing protein [Oligoflexia bacterium]